MARYPYTLVDVFTQRPFGGNQLAVFLDAERIPESLYARIANEMNLAETTFVRPPADAHNHFHVRIFTPQTELPMAGHPTVGTAYVLTRSGRFDPRAGGVLRLEEGVGLVPVTVEAEGSAPGLITMQQPLPRFGPDFDDRALAAEALSLREDELVPGAPVQVVSCGVAFWFIALRTLDAVRRAQPRTDLWNEHFASLPGRGLFPFSLETEHPHTQVHGRMFGMALGIKEDPATGSANGPLGCYLVRHGLLPQAAQAAQVALVAEQGSELGRPSFLHVTIDREGDAISRVRVGGYAVSVGHGELEL